MQADQQRERGSFDLQDVFEVVCDPLGLFLA